MAAEALLQEESAVLWREYRRSGDVAIRNTLVLRHMGLVYQIANRYAALARDVHEDLIQEGCLGLIRAIERFRPEYGVQFSTYAYPVISGTIKNHLRERRRLLGQSRPRPAEGQEAALWRPGSAFREGEELVSPEALEALPEQVEEDFSDQVVERMLAHSLLGRLPALERQIVKHFFYDDLTQREVARVVARSTSRISRLLRRALERIRASLVDIQREEGRLITPMGGRPEIATASVVDVETGLFGPEHLRRSLQREMGRAQTLGAPLSLALVRPDGASGPVTPDILSQAAKRIYQLVRVLDHVFRAGPGELGLIFSLPQREAVMVCRRFENGASATKLQFAIATFPQDATSASGLLAAAKARLDQA
jgi:RNA polymerase sigma factor (sigma-70 family)